MTAAEKIADALLALADAVAETDAAIADPDAPGRFELAAGDETDAVNAAAAAVTPDALAVARALAMIGPKKIVLAITGLARALAIRRMMETQRHD